MRDEFPFFESRWPEPGSTIGPWLVVERLDSGTYGVVYRVQRTEHPEAGSFALKVARNSRDARFVREAALLQRIQHPHVPRFVDQGLWTAPDGSQHPYLVMQLAEGVTLYEWAAAQPRTSMEVMQVLAQAAWAIDAVHSAGAVHRDVKGDNIRVTPAGHAFLVDFGSGWLPDARPLTDTTAPPGTTQYRSPEMLRFMWRFRRDPDARWMSKPTDDLYSLGVTAYRLVTGTYLPPIIDEEPRTLVPPSEHATIGPALDSLILRLLSENWDARGTAREIAQTLERAMGAAGPEAHRPILPTAAMAPTEEGVPPPIRSSSVRVSRRSKPLRASRPQLRKRSSPLLIWLSQASAAIAGGLIVAVILQRTPTALPQHEPQREPEIQWVSPIILPLEEKPDAGTAGLGDAGTDDRAFASLEELPHGGMVPEGIGRQMPPTPFNNQRKPPCEPRMETTINGGCWILIGRMEPPCGAKAFEWEGECYTPSFDVLRQPTSGEP